VSERAVIPKGVKPGSASAKAAAAAAKAGAVVPFRLRSTTSEFYSAAYGNCISGLPLYDRKKMLYKFSNLVTVRFMFGCFCSYLLLSFLFMLFLF
jgi:hypothetical protein